MDKKLETFMDGLSRKFYAKLLRIAEECHEDPAVVVNKGVELYRKQYRLENGPLGEFLNSDALQQYRTIQSIQSKKAAAQADPEFMHKRGLAAAAGRVRSLKAKKVAAAKKAADKP